MALSQEIKEFILAHLSDNTDKLLLRSKQYPDIDVPFAVKQILARRQIKDKLPSWYADDDIVFPSHLSTEQCSSEITAKYKQSLIKGNSVCDLTGGLGVDCSFMAQKVEKAIYIERFTEYCEAAHLNFSSLGIHNIDIVNKDAYEMVENLKVDTVYIDPARRDNCNKRVFALTDCEPDILQLKPLLLERALRIIIKISPMADIEETLRLLPETLEVHVLSVKNECKELLFILEPENYGKAPLIHTFNYTGHTPSDIYVFTPKKEKHTEPAVTSHIGRYLYEPNTSILKAGAFKSVGLDFNVNKIHRHSHLYTSDSFVETFPGRIFEIDEVYEFSGKLLKSLHKQIPKANMTTRNFILSVAELRQRSRIKEGGEVYLFATTLANGKRVIIRCHKTAGQE